MERKPTFPVKPSRLPGNSSPALSKSDSLPILKINSQSEGILIPSVKLERSTSRNDRSMDDSKSIESLGSRSFSTLKAVKGSGHSLLHPVKMVGKREMQVAVSTPKELPYTKLDILEAYLPKSLRNESAAKKRLQLQNESDSHTLFNILKGNQGQMTPSLSVASYNPVHYASGDYSVVHTAASAENHFTNENGMIVAEDDGEDGEFGYIRPSSQNKPTLWQTNAVNGMLAREEIKRQVEEAEALARSEEIQGAIVQQKVQIKEKTMQKVKVLNDIMKNKIKLEEAIAASASQLTHLPHIRHKKAAGVSDYAIQNEAFHVDFRNPMVKPDEEIDYEAFERAQMPAFKQRVISVKHNAKEGDDGVSYYSKDLKSVNSYDYSEYSESESLSSDVLRTLQDLGASEIKAKLKNLANYINSHTSRKILDSWYLIEGRFKSSTHSKSVIELDSNGLAHPVKHPAIPLSALAYMLCSTKIKVGHEELQKMCNRLGFISPEQSFQARKIAAMQVVLAMNDEVKSEHYEEFKQEMWHLSKGGEPLVSLQEFTDIIFPEDPEEREKQFEQIRGGRQMQVQAMMDEKKNKAAMVQRAAARKKQMIDDFTIALSQMQVMKGYLTQAKVTEFSEMIVKCKEYIEKQNEDQAANVPQDLVLFLGLEAYPPIIQQKIIEKREARQAQLKARKCSDASSTTINSAANPFSKANLAAKRLPPKVAEGEDASVNSESSKVLGIAEALSRNDSLTQLSADDIPGERRSTNTSTATPQLVPGTLKIRIPSYIPIALAGPPPVLDVMKEMVSFGRGLHGISYRDAISVLQSMAVTKIIQLFRCYRKRWRYSAARRMWQKRFLQHCHLHFSALRVLVKHKVSIRKRCWRKIMAWRFYTKRAHERRETFRIAFWPFYVWHRYADAQGKAKDKAHFLVGRVIPTLLTIKVFKAWKSYAQKEGRLNRLSDGNYRTLLRADTAVLFHWLKRWAHKRHAIRRSWNTGGNEMRLRYIARLVLHPFYTWRSFTNFRLITRGRAKKQQHQMRHVILNDKMPRHSLSNSQRRVAMKVLEIKKRLKLRKVSKDELKDKLKKRAKAKKDMSHRKSGMNTKASPHSPTRHGESASTDDDSVSSSRGSNIRRRESSTRTGSVAVEVPLDFHDAVASMFQPNFKWEKVDLKEFYDIDTDQEDEDGLTPFLLTSYRTAGIAAMESPESFDFYSKLTHPMANHSMLVREFYSFADHWNSFEASFRFHFFGYRAFKNIQHYAVQRRKVRLFMKIRHQRIKQQIINELRSSVEVRAKRNVTVRGSEAERISQAVRAHQVAKIVRARKLTNEVNTVLGRDHDDPVDDDAAREKRIRALNLIDPDDEEYMEKEKNRLEERKAELRRQQMERDKQFRPPNLLEEDRKDRELEHNQAEEMVAFGKTTREKTMDLVKTSDEITDAFRNKMNKTLNMVNEVLESESAVTTRAAEKQAAYMAQFKVHAARALVDKLLKVYLEVQMSLMKEESKVYFRCLRIPMLLTRSKHVYYRKKMMNWIRICRRLNSISRNAHYYQRTRTKWVIFNRWLKYIAVEKLNPTPGLVPLLQRKAQLIPDFDLTLQKEGFEKSVYLDSKRLNTSISEFSAVFSRWKMLTQEDRLFRIMEEKAQQMFRLSILQKCFWAMKTGLDQSDYMPLIRAEIQIFPIVRLRADLDQIVKRFIVARRKSIATVVKKNNRKYVKFIIHDGQTALSFKNFLTEFIANTNSRISTEQRMISEYFEERGTQQFNDVHGPAKDSPIIPQVMCKVTGRAFSDPHEISADGRSIAVPGGYKLSRVKFAFQHGLGIIGWQLFWSADGAMELESPQRGSWTTASLGANELIIPKDDFLVGLEYLYDSDVIVGVRLKLFFGGFTRMIGGKTSLSTLGVYLDCDNSTEREEYEDVRDSNLDKEELANSAMPYKFVIGFTGVITSGRTTCLGLVVRKVTKQNLFSYNWVGDALWKIELEKSEAAAEATLPSLDMFSMPTHLSGYVAGPPIGPPPPDGGDSLTMSADLSNVDESNYKDDNMSVAESLDESMSQSSFPGSSTIADDEESIDSKSHSQVTEQKGEGELGTPVPVKPRARRMGISNPILAKALQAPRQAVKEQLTSSEVQFFDVLRMRTTELSHARSRATDFARNLWTNKNLRLDNSLSKLVVIRIVRGLTMWLFNALSKRLMPLATTEKSALKLLRNSRKLLSKADNVRNRVNQILMNADVLESSAQLWTGKHLLSPKERALKAEHHKKIAAMRAEAARVKRDETFLRLQAVIDEKRGVAQMPKLTLSQFVVNNYRLKLAAARHKESLLERMTLDEVKTGLFGSNLREKLLSKEQMQAIHESLRSQNLKLKDVTSLDRLVDGVVAEEGELASREPKRSIALPSRRRTSHLTDLAHAPSLQRKRLDGSTKRKLSESVALRLNAASLVNQRARSPLVLTDRVPSPEHPNSREGGARSYSILEFNPLILPEGAHTDANNINSAHLKQHRRTSPNRRYGSVSASSSNRKDGVLSVSAEHQPSRARTMAAPKKINVSPPRVKRMSSIASYGDDSI